MPWTIRKQGSKWAVVRKDTGKVVKAHDTQSQAQAHMRALYANAKDVK